MDLTNHRTIVPGDCVYLRVLEETDATAAYARWLNDPLVNAYLQTRRTTVAELQEYIREKLASEQCLFFGIFWKENEAHIGNVKLEPIDFAQGYADMGILIGEKSYWGRGIATEVTQLILKYAFVVLGLKEVILSVDAENKSALRVYEKCGFTIYKHLPQALNYDGVLHDKIYMKKIREDEN